MYSKHTVFLTKAQEKNIASAIKDGKPVSVRMSAQQLKKSGNDPVFLTKTQLNKMNKSKRENKGMILKMSKKQIDFMRAQAKKGAMEGSGIGAVLASLAPTLIPLATDLIGNLLGGKKKGNGVFLPGTNTARYGRGHAKKGAGTFLPGSGVPLNEFLDEMGMVRKGGMIYAKKKRL